MPPRDTAVRGIDQLIESVDSGALTLTLDLNSSSTLVSVARTVANSSLGRHRRSTRYERRAATGGCSETQSHSHQSQSKGHFRTSAYALSHRTNRQMQMNNGERIVTVDEEYALEALSHDLCNLYAYPQSFEGVSPKCTIERVFAHVSR